MTTDRIVEAGEPRAPNRAGSSLVVVVAFVASGAVALKLGSGTVAVLWAALWGSLFIALRSSSILLVMTSLVIFFQQSVWYIGSGASPTIFELEVSHVKPVDLLVLAVALRWILRAAHPLRIDRLMRKLWFGWVVVSVVGISVGMARGIPSNDILVISEFRNLWYAAALLPTILQGIRELGLAQLCRTVLAMASVKAALALASVALGTVLVWPTAAHGYAGGKDAVYGGDEDVAVVMFAAVIGSGWLSQRRLADEYRLHNWSRFFAICGIILCALSGLLSLRRGAFVTAGVAAVVFSFLAGRKIALKWSLVTVFAFGTITAVVTVYPSAVPPSALALWGRVTGSDERAVMSDVGRWFDVQDGFRAAREHPIFGLGAGGRVRTERLMRYHLDPDSLLVHQAVIHTWLKFGLLGIAWYLTTFFAPLSLVFRHRRLLRAAPGGLITIAIAGFLVGAFVWELFTPPFFQNFRETFLVLLSSCIIVTMARHVANTRLSGIDY